MTSYPTTLLFVFIHLPASYLLIQYNCTLYNCTPLISKKRLDWETCCIAYVHPELYLQYSLWKRSHRCNLFREEKHFILKASKDNLLNKRTDIISKCHHKFYVMNLRRPKKWQSPTVISRVPRNINRNWSETFSVAWWSLNRVKLGVATVIF